MGDSSPTTNLLVNDLRKLGPFLQPWTPQQDLEDDSSSDPDPVEHNNLNESHGAGRAATASGHSRLLKDLSTMEDVVAQKHVFSLSLPRDNHHSVGANLLDKGVGAVASSLVGSDKHFFSSLQKTKLGHCYSDAAAGRSQQAAAGNDNWFLGRSQPNSIEKSHPMPSLSDNVSGQFFVVLLFRSPVAIELNSLFRSSLFTGGCGQLDEIDWRTASAGDSAALVQLLGRWLPLYVLAQSSIVDVPLLQPPPESQCPRGQFNHIPHQRHHHQ